MTARDQLYRLPSPYAELAINRSEEQGINLDFTEYYVSQAISYMRFNDTPEGVDFWVKVREYADATFDSPPPELPPIYESSKLIPKEYRFKTMDEELPPQVTDILVKAPNGVYHIAQWRHASQLFTCQTNDESTDGWTWKLIEP